MKTGCDGAGKRLKGIGVFAGLTLTAMLFAAGVNVQAQGAEQKAAESKPMQESYQIFHLINARRVMDLNDVQTELRNMLPRTKIYGVQSQNAIAIQGSAEDLATALKMISELDKQRKVYRLTYTITEMEGGKRVGAEHFGVIVSAGGKSTVKQGSRVPIETASSDTKDAKPQTQVQYVDVGLSIDATLDGDSLRSRVELSSMPEERAGMSALDPVIQQTVLDCTSHLTEGKAVVLGSLDIPGGTRHKEVEVAAELVQ